MNHYPATYSDAHGFEATTLFNDGQTLKLVLRGVEFAGDDFDMLEPIGATPEQLTTFTLQQGELCACRITCRMPVPVQAHGQRLAGMLLIDLVLGDPSPNGGIDREDLQLLLEFDDQRFASPGRSGWFEDELLQLQSQLPEGVFIKACINCLYSDYSPYGHGLFGWMMCFRSLKAEYLKVASKDDLFRIHDQYEQHVQETWLCPEFERRVPGTGYRG